MIIVTYNAMEWAERCLSSVRNSTIPVDVYVVDNGSTDGTQNFILTHYSEVHFFQSKVNLGFGKANNLGLQYALNNDYDYVYLLNQDAWVEADTIEKLVGCNTKYREYGILSPIQLQANKQRFDNNFAQIVCAFHSNKDILSDFYFGTNKQVYPVLFVMAAHWLISKECLKKVGGFSPTFSHYGEDDNYIDRAIFHGYKVGIVPEARAVHDREDRQYSKEKQIYFAYTHNLVFCSKLTGTAIKKMVYITKNTVVLSLRNRSLLPFIYWVKIVFLWKKIMYNLKVSKSPNAAFIT